MLRFARAIVIAAALASVAVLPVSGAQAQDAAKQAQARTVAPKKPAAKKAVAKGEVCTRKRGRGWAPTENLARFQAWEIVAQSTGNWPFMVDTFRNETYQCQPDGGQWKCLSQIDVCKKA